MSNSTITPETVQAAIDGLQFLATALIGLVVYVQTQRLKRAEITAHTHEAYNVLNSVALSSVDNLRTFDALGRPNTIDTDDSRRKRWAAFVWIVTLQGIFLSNRDRLIGRGYANQSLRQQLELILKDDLVFWLILNRGFDPKFASFCSEIRLVIAPNKPLHYTESEAISGLSDQPFHEVVAA